MVVTHWKKGILILTHSCLLFNIIREMLLFNIINEKLLFGALSLRQSFFLVSHEPRIQQPPLCADPFSFPPALPSPPRCVAATFVWAEQSEKPTAPSPKHWWCCSAEHPSQPRREALSSAGMNSSCSVEKHTSLSCYPALFTLTHYSPMCFIYSALHTLPWLAAACRGRFISKLLSSNSFGLLPFWRQVLLHCGTSTSYLSSFVV